MPKPIDTIVISVGGSLIVPAKGIDTAFLSSFATLIRKYVKEGKRFVVITGGGRTARTYQDAAHGLSTITPDDLDWLGIHATRLNGHLLRAILRDISCSIVAEDPHSKVTFSKPVVIAAGWKPGYSTDYDAVLLAQSVCASRIVNLSNITHAYTGDPKTDPNAKPINDISWKAFRKLLPKKWSPGLSSPFDPVASKEAEKLGLEVAIMHGKKLQNLEAYIDGRPFVGTRVRP